MALAGGLVASMLVPTSAYADPACGDSLNQDVKLHQDLDCSAYAGNALEIVHKGVTVDLNGHKLIGPASQYHGIDGSAGYDNLAIKDGTIEGFYHAVELFGNKDSTISKLKIELGGTNDDYGVYVGEAPRLHMSKITIHNADYGFYLYHAAHLKLVHSKVTGGDPSDFYTGVYGSDSAGRIDDVHVKGANYAFYLYSLTAGYEVTDSSANDGGYVGFYVANAHPNANSTLSHNTANDNDEFGFRADRDAHGSHNRAKGNGTKNCRHVHCV